jgi:hypothetical protein
VQLLALAVHLVSPKKLVAKVVIATSLARFPMLVEELLSEFEIAYLLEGFHFGFVADCLLVELT